MFLIPFLATAVKTVAVISASEYFVIGAMAAQSLKNKKKIILSFFKNTNIDGFSTSMLVFLLSNV